MYRPCTKSTKGVGLMRTFGSYVLPIAVAVLYLFLYIPIFVLILFSFNNNSFTCGWNSFTMHWYYELFASTEVWSALKNSLLVSFSAVVLSLTIGSSFIFFGSREMVKRLLILFYGKTCLIVYIYCILSTIKS